MRAANILYLGSRERNIIGVDLSEDRIEIAKRITKDNPNMEFFAGDVNRIKLAIGNLVNITGLLEVRINKMNLTSAISFPAPQLAYKIDSLRLIFPTYDMDSMSLLQKRLCQVTSILITTGTRQVVSMI